MKNFLGLLLTTVVLMACNKKPEAGNFTLNLSHEVDGERLALDNMRYSSPAGHTYEITKLWYYLSDIRLIETDGTIQNAAEGFLVKAEDTNTQSISLNDVAAGNYNKIQFQFGISKANNVEDYLVATVDNQSMFWPEQMEAEGEKGDYHYMKLEGNYDSLKTGKLNPYIVHSGPTNGADNSFIIEFPLEEFEINNNSAELNIKVNLKEWLQNPTVYDFKDWKMVMMNQNAQNIYKANAQSVFSAGQLTISEE